MKFPDRPTVGFAFETITIDNSVTSLTRSIYAPGTGGDASRAYLTLENGSIRYRYDGGNPTANVGHLLMDGNFLVLEGEQQLSDFKAIRTESRNGTISITYERI